MGMDDSFFTSKLLEEFRLADEEYRCDDEMDVDVAATERLPRSLHDESESEGEEDDTNLQADLCPRELDEAESTLIDGFMANGCGCSLGPGKLPCSKLFSREEISST